MLADQVGAWRGENAFRLMPDDPPHVAPAAAVVRGGRLTTIEYTWAHPDDGPQTGTLALGPGPEGEVLALWADSWHQAPDARVLEGRVLEGRVLEGRVEGDVVRVGYDYVEGAWRWEIVVEPGAAGLVVRMDNVDLVAGERYAAMSLRLTPGASGAADGQLPR